MNLKYFIGKTINDTILKLIEKKPTALSFIPNGKFMELDLIRSKEKITTIFDVGANIGQTALNYTKIFPKACIHSFEPVKDTFNILTHSTRDKNNIKPVHLALGAEKGILNIQINNDSQINSLNILAFELNAQSENIVIETGETYCNENNIRDIDLLKIDVEGYELNVLNGFSKAFLRGHVKFIYCEVGFDRTDPLKTHFSDIEDYLRGLGFVTSGFYEASRWGKSKLLLGFCNALFSNKSKVNIF